MNRIFVDVDTQNDFMNKDGSLYVPGAEEIKPNLAKLSAFAEEKGITVFYTLDNHTKGDAELKRNGGPFPDHCMFGTDGWKKIKETSPSMERLEKLNFRIVLKNSYDMFSNPRSGVHLKGLGYPNGVIYGVATDYCIKAAVLGILKRKMKVMVIEDAIAGVDKKTTSEAITEMKDAGAIFMTTEEFLKED